MTEVGFKYQNTLTEHEVVNSSLLWNKIRPCSSTKIISPPWRLLEFRKTYCFRWQPWKTRVHEEEFNTLVIYPVPSLQKDAVGNWNGNSLTCTGLLQTFVSESAVTTVQVVETSVTVNNSRELKQQRRRQQRERQKTIRLDWQNNNFACITPLCSFFCRHWTTTTWKCLISRFVENSNTRERLGFPFPGLRYSVLELNSRKKLPTFDELNKAPDERVYLGVRTCELFLCFVPFVFLGFIVLTSLFSLFYFTGEFNRFLHRGWAWWDGISAIK